MNCFNVFLYMMIKIIVYHGMKQFHFVKKIISKQQTKYTEVCIILRILLKHSLIIVIYINHKKLKVLQYGNADSFNYNDFDKNVGKYVRFQHLKTDANWSKTWENNKIINKN